MRRIYFLVPNIEMTHKIVDELHYEEIEDRHIHILANRDTSLQDLPEAGVTIKTDFISAIERGAALGGTTGLLAGMVSLRFAGFALAGGALLGILLAGATIGSLMSGLSGLAIGNSRLKKFEAAIEKGEFLLLIDIPKNRINEVSDAIKKHHPEAEFDGIEPLLPHSF